MAFSASEKVQVRRWLGYSQIFRDEDPRLENAMTSAEEFPEVETAVRGWLTDLTTLETAMKDLWVQMQVYRGDGGESLDALRGRAGLAQEGRRLVGHLADTFNTKPIRDVFSASPPRGPEVFGLTY